ncbi:MAG: hypothetical protein ACRD2X_01120, partial [Vicinamibacteraceae bacterium]
GVLSGMALSLTQVAVETSVLDASLPLYVGFPLIAVASTLVTVAVTLATRPTDMKVLESFYRSVQPAGRWGPVIASATPAEPGATRSSFGRDAFNTGAALVAISTLYVGTLYLVLNRHAAAAWCFATTAALAAVLARTWYRYLPPSEPIATDQDG